MAPRLWSTGSTDVVHRLRCFEACGIFPGQGSNLGLPRWQADSLPLSHQRSPPTLKKKKVYMHLFLWLYLVLLAAHGIFTAAHGLVYGLQCARASVLAHGLSFPLARRVSVP